MPMRSLVVLAGAVALANLMACRAGDDTAPAAPEPVATVFPGVAADATSAAAPLPKVSVAVTRQTDNASHEANAAAIWFNAANPGASRIFGTGGSAGIEVYDLAGKRLSKVATGGEVKGLDILPAFQLAGEPAPLLVALDVHTPAVLVFAIDPASGALQRRELRNLEITGAFEGLCTYQSQRDGGAYIFLAMDSGKLQQWWLQPAADGALTGRHMRDLNVASKVAFCTTDVATGSLYVSEDEIGIWRFNADLETESVPEIIDIVRFGAITGEVGGVAVYRNQAGAALLLASNASDDSIHFYDINNDHRRFAAAVLEGGADIGRVNEAGGLAVTALPLGTDLDAGLLVAMDNDNGEGATNYKLVRWADVEAGLGADAMAALVAEPAAPPAFARVLPVVATEPVAMPGDAADDPAIWVHPVDPARSTLIGTNKQGGLYVYNLDGATSQYLEDGQMNNVDVRYNFSLGGQAVDLVTASNLSDNSIAIYKVDAATGLLVDVADGTQPTNMSEPYGQCMYQNPQTRATYVFINDKSGLYRQWELKDSGNGRVRAEQRRDFSVPSQPEGCVADDEYGVLYVGEEAAALWKFSAAPDGGTEGGIITTVADNPALRNDIEGVTLYYGKDGAGYVIVSSQGNDSYAVYERAGENAYLGSFVIVANAELNLDGASETDGIDVISTPLGERFPYGLFVAQDGRNLMPMANQDYKVVPWESIADALGLEKYSGWNPRQAVLRH